MGESLWTPPEDSSLSIIFRIFLRKSCAVLFSPGIFYRAPDEPTEYLAVRKMLLSGCGFARREPVFVSSPSRTS
jgi:hypothetical protein